MKENNSVLIRGGRINRINFLVNHLLVRFMAACAGFGIVLTCRLLQRIAMHPYLFIGLFWGWLGLACICEWTFAIINGNKRLRDIYGAEPHWIWTIGMLTPILSLVLWLYLHLAPGLKQQNEIHA